jgi:hypothetical protein
MSAEDQSEGSTWMKGRYPGFLKELSAKKEVDRNLRYTLPWNRRLEPQPLLIHVP